jgi:hypothetical protein
MSPARLLEDVSDTARWVAYYRALESERPDALFRDPWTETASPARFPFGTLRAPTGKPAVLPVETLRLTVRPAGEPQLARGAATLFTWRLSVSPEPPQDAEAPRLPTTIATAKGARRSLATLVGPRRIRRIVVHPQFR